MELEQFDTVIGTFNPRINDDLVAGAKKWIGHKGEWQAAWLIEEGEYSGEWAMTPMGDDRLNMPFAWIPSGDIEV